jgi:DNA replication protein DnaC
MNRYRPSYTAEEYLILSKRPPFPGECPNCGGKGYYEFRDKRYECELDYDGIHIARKLSDEYTIAGIPIKYQRLIWADLTLQPEAKTEVDEYLEYLENAITNGVGLFIFSKGLGTGKTFIATHILKEAIKSGKKGFYISFFRLLDLHQQEDYNERLKKLNDVELLVIDDVIAGKVSTKQANFYSDTLEKVVRERAHNSLATIITSNLELQEMDEEYERIFSLMADSNIPLKLSSAIDAREHIGWEASARNMLKGEVAPIL